RLPRAPPRPMEPSGGRGRFDLRRDLPPARVWPGDHAGGDFGPVPAVAGPARDPPGLPTDPGSRIRAPVSPRGGIGGRRPLAGQAGPWRAWLRLPGDADFAGRSTGCHQVYTTTGS